MNKQQDRASFALKTIKQIMINGYVEDKDVSLMVGLPNMILSNGIGQTMAFLCSKAKPNSSHEKVSFALIRWISLSVLNREVILSNFEYFEYINSISSSEYIVVQTETLRMVEWLKRYARAFSKNKDGNNERNNTNS